MQDYKYSDYGLCHAG